MSNSARAPAPKEIAVPPMLPSAASQFRVPHFYVVLLSLVGTCSVFLICSGKRVYSVGKKNYLYFFSLLIPL